MQKPMSDRTKAEMAMGKWRVKTSMAQGILDALEGEVKHPKGVKFRLVALDDVVDNWKVAVSVSINGAAFEFEEDWMDFPNPETLAKLMLLGVETHDNT